MPLTAAQIAEIRDYAERFVGAFVKRGARSPYTVCGTPSGSIDHAVDLAMRACGRPAVSPLDRDEQEALLRECLSQEIKNIADS